MIRGQILPLSHIMEVLNVVGIILFSFGYNEIYGQSLSSYNFDIVSFMGNGSRQRPYSTLRGYLITKRYHVLQVLSHMRSVI